MSTIFRFLHTGDLHLDSPFVGLSSEVPESVAAVLREATFRSWARVVGLALAERIDFVLVAGDVFEQANHTLRAQLRFRDGLAELAGAGIPSFVVTGNHDPESEWTRSVAWPELAHRFGADAVDARPVVRGGEEIARVYGIGYPTREVTANLAARIHREPDVAFAIGLLHANVGADTSADNSAPCTLGDLRDGDMDYWALGHIHRPRIVSNDRPTAVYCGNPQGRDPGETDPRGCFVVTVGDGAAIQPDFRATDVVRWQSIAVSIDGLASEDALIDALVVAVDGARTATGRSIVARVHLTGRGPLHSVLGRAGVVADLLVLARERLGEGAPFAWVESVRDETRIELDLDERRVADDFLGDVLRRFADTRRALDAGAGGELEAVLDELYSSTRARRYLRDRRPGPADLARLLAAAEGLVADRLVGEE